MKKFLLLLPLLCAPLHVYAQDIDFGDIDIGDEGDDNSPAIQKTQTPSQPLSAEAQTLARTKAARLYAKKLAVLKDTNVRIREIEAVLDMPMTKTKKRQNEPLDIAILRDNDKRLMAIQKVLDEPGTQLVRHNSLEENVRDVQKQIKQDGILDTDTHPIYTN